MAASRVSAGGPIAFLADTFGATEPALRLLLSILIGYPLAFFHRQFLYGKLPCLQHLYFVSCGLFLGYFNYGADILHSVVCVLIMYVILLTIGGTLLSVIVSFTVFMTYLMYGYYMTGTDDYDIKWSMPQCVLTLRLIGLAFDVYDGQKNPDKLPTDQKKTAIHKRPSLLEIAGHTYFFGGFMVGPQFPMKRYVDFIEGKFPAKTAAGKPLCVGAAVTRLSLGILVLSIYQIGSIFLPERTLLTDEFVLLPFWKRAVIIGIWGKIALYKYIACWLISEGSCILTGMTYNGQDKNGNDTWDGCANVKLWDYTKTATFDGIIRSFNINTNLWVAQYIFKRLKFLGNKSLSQAATLMFLAWWHGLHSGYYVCFFNEFIVMWMEKDVESVINRLPKVKGVLTSSALQIPLFLMMKAYVVMMMGYCIVPFVLLSWDRYTKAYASVYFIGHVIYLGWPLVAPVIKMLLRTKQDKLKSQ